jgi:hypothetical protein
VSQYRLVLRAADLGEGAVTRSLRPVLRAAASIATGGMVSPVGPSELDVVDSVTGEVVGTWFDPPSAESAPAWLPKLQHELEVDGLDAFRQKYLGARHFPAEPPSAPSVPPPDGASSAAATDVDEADLDRRWEQLPPL